MCVLPYEIVINDSGFDSLLVFLSFGFVLQVLFNFSSHVVGVSSLFFLRNYIYIYHFTFEIN